MWAGYSIENKIVSWAKVSNIRKMIMYRRDGVKVTITQKEEGKLPVTKINTEKKNKKRVEKIPKQCIM